MKDICVKFDTPESAMEEMLAHWERKGKVRRMDSASCGNPCGQKCAGCPVLPDDLSMGRRAVGLRFGGKVGFCGRLTVDRRVGPASSSRFR